VVLRALDEASSIFQRVSKTTRFLDALAWPRSVEREFFARGAAALPSPRYEVDRDAASDNLAALRSLDDALAGEHLVLAWLRNVQASYEASNRMLLEVGTRRFYELSREVYGGARTTSLDVDTTNLDFAEHVAARLGPVLEEASPARHAGRRGANEERLDADAFIASVESRLARRRPKLALELVKDEDLSAKVLCGMTRLRVREGATFDPVEARGLYFHEVETHALTAQNGDLQDHVPFLRGGGPRTTRAQEGLAVFAELYEHSLTSGRLRRLVERVRMVAMAEDGATFLDLYRYLLERGEAPQNAYLDARRICRGGPAEGGAPFTKDASYLAGLMEVYNFLRVTVRAHAGYLPRLLVTGRLALEDLEPLAWLRGHGLLAEPRYLPRWAERWDELLAYFAFTSFLNEVDLAPIEARFSRLLDPAALLET
jgi:uncharacterized protein (TIGR02421 family)